MKIAVFSSCFGLDNFGGPAIRISNLCKIFINAGLDIDIFCNNDVHPEYDIPNHVYKVHKFNKNKYNVFWVEQDWHHIIKLNKEGILPIIGTNILPCSASQHTLPYVYGVEVNKQAQRLRDERNKIKTLQGKFWLAQSDFQEKEYRKLGLPFSVPVLYAPNPVDNTKFYPRFAKHHDNIIIGWTGKDNWWKQPQMLAYIARALPDIEFRYYSEAHTDLDLGHNIRKITGNTNSAMPNLLRQCDFFLSTSCTELQPLGILEAQATGLPVIAFRTSAIPEIIEHGKTGLLVDLGNWEHSIVEIKRLLSGYYNIEKLKKNSRQFVVENFNEKIILDQYKLIFKKYLEMQ